MDKDIFLFEKMNEIHDNRISLVIKASINQFENNLLESQYKIIEENRTKDDLFYLYTEAKEDFKQKMLSIIKRIRDEMVKFINQISYSIGKFMTSLQIKIYSKKIENIENFLINKIGLSNEDAIAFTERFSTYTAILEKKMMIYDKFTLMVEQRNVRGKPITEQELEQFEKTYSSSIYNMEFI